MTVPTPTPAAGEENSALARLAAALNPADPHPDRVLAASDAGVLEVLAAAREHRVSALLGRALERAGRLESLSEPVRAALRRNMLDAAMGRAELDEAILAAADALKPVPVPFLLLKGAALGSVVYAEPALRPMTDVDILVHPIDVDRALAALGPAGFELPTAAERAFWEDAYYNLPLRSPSGASVELHWSIAQPTRHRPDIGGLFARSRDAVVAGRELRTLGAADLLLHQALHLSYHYFEPKLIWIHDLAALHRADPPADEILARARRWEMQVPLALSVLQVEKCFPGAAHPALREFACGSARARVIAALFRSRRSVQLIAKWDRRWVQLILAIAMLDRPTQLGPPVWSWLRRTLRHGDRAGARRRVPGDP